MPFDAGPDGTSQHFMMKMRKACDILYQNHGENEGFIATAVLWMRATGTKPLLTPGIRATKPVLKETPQVHDLWILTLLSCTGGTR